MFLGNLNAFFEHVRTLPQAFGATSFSNNLCDVPSFGYRPRDIRNGLSMPPKMTLTNIINASKRPHWALQTLIHGQPSFEILKPYMSKNLNLNQLAKFVGYSSKLAKIVDASTGLAG